MSVYSRESIEALINTANPDPDILWEAMGGNPYETEYTQMMYQDMWYQYENAPTIYRQNFVENNSAYWNSFGEPITESASEVMVPEAVVDEGVVKGTKAVKMPQTTTGAGTVKSGALAGRIPIGTAVAGVAIGAGIGLKEVKEHPKFWNDLSNAVFKDLTDADTLLYKPGRETETFNVVWRMLNDGSIQSYCDKRTVDKIVHELYEADAFNVVDHIEQETSTAGSQVVNMGSITNGFVSLALTSANIGVSSTVLTLFDAGLVRYPQTQAIYITARKNRDTLLGSLSVNYYNIPSGTMTVYGTPPNGLYINASSDQKLGALDVNINSDGSIMSFNWYDGSGQTDIPIGAGRTTTSDFYTSYVSNVGSKFKEKNPAVIYNGTDLLPPDVESDFWTTFASWLANGFTINPYNPLTNATEPVTYIPITAPDINWQNDPITGDQANAWKGIYDFVSPFTTPGTTPVNNPSPWIYQSIGSYTSPDIKIPDNTPWDNNPKFPNVNPFPNGSSPTLVDPTSGVGTGSKLYSVYNPLQAQVDALGAYLWNSSILDSIAKFFQNNPLDAIISLHMVYVTPTTGTSKNIILGYLDSGVSSATVVSQYETLECGDVDIPEMYGNVLDYTGVSVQIFLPFIGWRSLKCREVMGKRVRVEYKIDVYTGTCLAMLHIISANNDQLLYTFEGNCSVQIPLTASDRTRLISGLITAGVSAFTGNPAGVVGGIASIGNDIERSGGFSGNAGAMGVKKPYIAITRSIDAQASGYNTQYGYPINKSGYLVNFKGYTRVKSVHVDIPTATEFEQLEIESMLKEGIII